MDEKREEEVRRAREKWAMEREAEERRRKEESIEAAAIKAEVLARIISAENWIVTDMCHWLGLKPFATEKLEPSSTLCFCKEHGLLWFLEDYDECPLCEAYWSSPAMEE